MFIYYRVAELVDYGYTLEELKREFPSFSDKIIEACYEQRQKHLLDKNRPTREVGKCDTTPGNENPKFHSRDKNITFYELIWEYGRDEVNYAIKNFGTAPTARFFDVERKDILALRQHYDWNKGVPEDWKVNCTYIPEEVRRNVDKRDNRRCIRCNRELTKDAERHRAKCIHYHKIQHPGPLNKSNIATLCSICRRRIRSQNKGKDTFEGMQFKDFKEWIEDNDPPVKKK